MTPSIDPHLFISYASVDRPAVMPVVDGLLGAGLPVWIDQADIPGATAYGAEIGAAIRRCRALVLCCSPASLVSPNVKQELMLAWKYQRPYLPLIMEWTSIPPDLEYWLEGVQWIEVVDRPSERWLPEILRAVDLLGKDAAATIAPARVQGGGPVGLPHPLTEILGRDSEIAEVAGLLAAHRLVTLTGPGGTGKTRLAIAAAHAVSAAFDGDAAFVDLSPVSDPELVGPMVARALGIRGTPHQSTFEAIKAGLGGKRLLLVLDNFEQVSGASSFVGDLLAACPRLVVLITSRIPLQRPGERTYPVQPLAIPETSEAPALADTALNPAVRLFVERAREARAGFVLDGDNAATVTAVCRRLEGLPLAIELAAARTRVLSPAAILTRLARPLALLTDGRAGSPSRQRTLRQTIAWSYDLLAPDEQGLFRRLAVFVDGFALDAAAAVAVADDDARDDEWDALDGVASLVDKSLLRRLGEVDGEPRFGMLETIRGFGLERLDSSGETAAVRQRHAGWFLRFAERFALPRRRSVLGAPAELRLLELEYANLRVALEWCAAERPAAGLRLAAALGGFWSARDHLGDGPFWLEKMLALDDGTEPAAWVSAAIWLSGLAGSKGEHRRASALLDEATATAWATGDTIGLATATVFRALMLVHGGGDVEEAARLGEEALAIFTQAGAPWGATMAHGLRAQAAHRRGDLELAAELYRRYVADFEAHGGDDYGLAFCLFNLGRLAAATGDRPQARTFYLRALHQFKALGDLGKVAWCLEAVALSGDPAKPGAALHLLAAADALRGAIATPLSPDERADIDRAAASLRATMDEPAFAAAWATGAALPVDAAIVVANET